MTTNKRKKKRVTKKLDQSFSKSKEFYEPVAGISIDLLEPRSRGW